jgi:hypothetical protein
MDAKRFQNSLWNSRGAFQNPALNLPWKLAPRFNSVRAHAGRREATACAPTPTYSCSTSFALSEGETVCPGETNAVYLFRFLSVPGHSMF